MLDAAFLPTVYIFIHKCMYTYIYIHKNTYIYIYLYVYICACMCVRKFEGHLCIMPTHCMWVICVTWHDSYLGHNSFIRVKLLNPHVWRDSFICVTWLIHSYGSFHWKCFIPKIHKIEKLRFLGISRYKFKLRFWFNLNLHREIWVSRIGGSRKM